MFLWPGQQLLEESDTEAQVLLVISHAYGQIDRLSMYTPCDGMLENKRLIHGFESSLPSIAIFLSRSYDRLKCLSTLFHHTRVHQLRHLLLLWCPVVYCLFCFLIRFHFDGPNQCCHLLDKHIGVKKIKAPG